MAELKEQTIEKEFVPYKIALALKELGFNHLCFGWYNYELLNLFGEDNLLDGYAGEENRPLAPTFSQAFRFFREKYNFISEINVYSTSDGYSYTFKILCKKYTPYKEANNAWVTYEEAEFECLKNLIEIAKGQNVK